MTNLTNTLRLWIIKPEARVTIVKCFKNGHSLALWSMKVPHDLLSFEVLYLIFSLTYLVLRTSPVGAAFLSETLPIGVL